MHGVLGLESVYFFFLSFSPVYLRFFCGASKTVEITYIFLLDLVVCIIVCHSMGIIIISPIFICTAARTPPTPSSP